MVDGKKVNSFEQLLVWQTAQDVAVYVYETARNFPKEEQFGLTSQVKRASSSISANIAEGFERKTIKDKMQFYRIAYGSLLETKNFLYMARRLSYIAEVELEPLLELVTRCQKLLNAFMSSLSRNT